jgi:ABC-type bacteriocin/lantibiotic exporter with double-glycine peptidase domain
VSGIACLGAVARFRGLEFSDSHLVQIAAPGPDALFTPASLVQVARKIGLTAKLVHMSWSRLGGLGQALPAILVLRKGEAVILSGIRQDAEKTEVVFATSCSPTRASNSGIGPSSKRSGVANSSRSSANMPWRMRASRSASNGLFRNSSATAARSAT